MPALKIARGQRRIRRVIDLAGNGFRERDQRRDKASVYWLRTLSQPLPWHIEEHRPVNCPISDRPETQQIREELDGLPARPQYVGLPDLRVAVSVGPVGELDRNERRAFGLIEPGPAGKDRVHEIAAGQLRQELVDDHPLVMPGERALCSLE